MRPPRPVRSRSSLHRAGLARFHRLLPPWRRTYRALLVTGEVALAVQVFVHFVRPPEAAEPLMLSMRLAGPALLIVAAVAVLQARPWRFFSGTLAVGLGAFLLLVTGLRLVELASSTPAAMESLRTGNLALAMLAPVIAGGIAGIAPGPILWAATLIYFGLHSTGYMMQYGSTTQLFQIGFMPLWVSWLGVLVWSGVRLILPRRWLRDRQEITVPFPDGEMV